jgi:ubiquinone/menaquinone biosynthesis C-methylase UbiE
MKAKIKHLAGRMLADRPAAREALKKLNEWAFWKLYMHRDKSEKRNWHYVRCYTEVFELERRHYDGKRILDVGCGPLGSLEWANNSSRRVGLDVLAKQYLAMNRGAQAMEYVTGSSEKIPFESSYFDVVSMFNALDHVSDVERSLKELQRVCKVGGDILLICEIDHPPTITEPHTIDEDILKKFSGFEILFKDVYQMGPGHNVYSGIFSRTRRVAAGNPSVLCARMRKVEDEPRQSPL